MIDILQYILAFVVTLGLVVSFHEFGHFWVARRCNVKILKFSLGFGKPLWSKRLGSDPFDLIVAPWPLGGYVKMLDERDCKIEPADASRTFNSKSLLQRSAIVLAGPLFNFLFSIIVFWLMFVIGISGLRPIVGSVAVGSIAEQAGMREGVEIIAVDSRQTKTWTSVASELVNEVVTGKVVNVTVSDEWATDTLLIDVQGISIDDLASQDVLTILGIGIREIQLPAIVGVVQAGLPAAKAGISPGDLIVSADGQPIISWQQWVKHVQATLPQQKIVLEVKRQAEYLTLEVIPKEKILEDGQSIGFVGVMREPFKDDGTFFSKDSYSVVPAFLRSLEKTWDMSWLTLSMLGKIVTGQVSTKHLSGPINIAQYAGDSAESGVVPFLWFLGIISISLGVLNLLPIPMLDGGHLLYYAIELLKGSPVSVAVQNIGQQIGCALLVSLMVLVTYNDIMRFL